MKLLEKMTLLALGVCSFGILTGCGDGDSMSETEDLTGEVGISLQLPGGTTIQSASYSIMGPKGFLRAGTIDVSASNTVTALISGIPAGRAARNRSAMIS